MVLNERLDAVEAARGLSDRAWSLKAKLSDRYVHTQRMRFKADPSYVMPEKGAAKLAAAAHVSAEWLRFGRGEMEPSTTQAPATNPRQPLVEQLARSVSELTASGDLEGARIALQSLNRLLGVEPEPAASPSTATVAIPAPKRAAG